MSCTELLKKTFTQSRFNVAYGPCRLFIRGEADIHSKPIVVECIEHGIRSVLPFPNTGASRILMYRGYEPDR